MKNSTAFLMIVYIALIFVAAPGCKKKGNEVTLDDLEQEQAQAEKDAEEEAAKKAQTKPAPAPRVNDDVYVEITARSALIRDKYKDDPNQAEKDIEALYEKFGVTFTEYKAFQDKLDPQKAGELARKTSDFMTKIANEYRIEEDRPKL